MDTMPVHTAQLYYFQSLQHQTGNSAEFLFRPDSLALLSNHTVSFNDGRAHGSWQFNSDRSMRCVTFHFKAQLNKTRYHEFQAIGESTCYVLTSRDGVVRTDAVLIPRMKPPPHTWQMPAIERVSDARGKRRRISAD